MQANKNTRYWFITASSCHGDLHSCCLRGNCHTLQNLTLSPLTLLKIHVPIIYKIYFSVICKLTVKHFSQWYVLFFVSSCCSESSFIYLVAAAGVAAVGGVLFGYDIGMKFFAYSCSDLPSFIILLWASKAKSDILLHVSPRWLCNSYKRERVLSSMVRSWPGGLHPPHFLRNLLSSLKNSQ